MTAWTNYVKQYAKDKGITYKNALKDPACASSYKSGKDKPAPAEPAKEDNIQMKIEEKPKKRGRPKKYAPNLPRRPQRRERLLLGDFPLTI